LIPTTDKAYKIKQKRFNNFNAKPERIPINNSNVEFSNYENEPLRYNQPDSAEREGIPLER